MLCAIKDGNLKRIRSIVDEYGQDNIDFTAIHGPQTPLSVIEIDDNLKYPTESYTPVLLAFVYNRLDIARYFLEELRLSLPVYLYKPRDKYELQV